MAYFDSDIQSQSNIKFQMNLVFSFFFLKKQYYNSEYLRNLLYLVFGLLIGGVGPYG